MTRDARLVKNKVNQILLSRPYLSVGAPPIALPLSLPCSELRTNQKKKMPLSPTELSQDLVSVS